MAGRAGPLRRKFKITVDIAASTASNKDNPSSSSSATPKSPVRPMPSAGAYGAFTVPTKDEDEKKSFAAFRVREERKSQFGHCDCNFGPRIRHVSSFPVLIHVYSSCRVLIRTLATPRPVSCKRTCEAAKCDRWTLPTFPLRKRHHRKNNKHKSNQK